MGFSLFINYPKYVNILYTGGLFHCYMLYVGRGVSSLFCCFYSIFGAKSCTLANNIDPDQRPHYVASDLGLQCLPMAFLWFPGNN